MGTLPSKGKNPVDLEQEIRVVLSCFLHPEKNGSNTGNYQGAEERQQPLLLRYAVSPLKLNNKTLTNWILV